MPKTKSRTDLLITLMIQQGTSYVYESILRPLVWRHETDIDKYLSDLRLRVWDLALYYWQNCTELGQGAFFQLIQFLLTQSQRLKSGNIGGAGAPQPQVLIIYMYALSNP